MRTEVIIEIPLLETMGILNKLSHVIKPTDKDHIYTLESGSYLNISSYDSATTCAEINTISQNHIAKVLHIIRSCFKESIYISLAPKLDNMNIMLDYIDYIKDFAPTKFSTISEVLGARHSVIDRHLALNLQ